MWKKLVHSEMQPDAAVSSSCANMVFPKIALAVIVGVTHGDKILMTKIRGTRVQKVCAYRRIYRDR